MEWLASWWDSVELWLTGLPFVAQLPIVIVVLVPLCLAVSVVLDRAADVLAGWTQWRKPAEPGRRKPAEPGRRKPAEPGRRKPAEPGWRETEQQPDHTAVGQDGHPPRD